MTRAVVQAPFRGVDRCAAEFVPVDDGPQLNWVAACAPFVGGSGVGVTVAAIRGHALAPTAASGPSTRLSRRPTALYQSTSARTLPLQVTLESKANVRRRPAVTACDGSAIAGLLVEVEIR